MLLSPLPALAFIPAPPIHNLHVGPLTLHIYGLIIGIGIIAGLRLMEHVLAKFEVDVSQFMSVMLPGVIGGFIGARLYHVLSEPVRYATHPGDIVAVWHGGLGIYGAVVGGTLTVWWRVRRIGGTFADWADAAAVGLPLAQAIGRWGNYVNQELFGRPTDAPWALRVDPFFRPAAHANDCCFHPTFLYESIGCLLLCVLLYTVATRWKHRSAGSIFLMYILGYSIIRIGMETLRIDTSHTFLGMRQNFWVSLTMGIGSIIALARVRVRSRAAQS